MQYDTHFILPGFTVYKFSCCHFGGLQRRTKLYHLTYAESVPSNLDVCQWIRLHPLVCNRVFGEEGMCVNLQNETATERRGLSY